MMHFVKQATQDKSAKTKGEWCDLVRKNWSMECDFQTGVSRELLTASWYMGDLRFEATELSGQQWTWTPGPGLDDWRKNTLLLFLIESGTIEIEQDGDQVELGEGSLLLFDGSIKYTQTSPDVALLKSLIAGAAAYGEQCSSYGARLVAEHLTDLMEIVTDDLTAPKRVTSSDALLKQAKRFIERNVANEQIDIDFVAAAMGVSRRYLTKLFERDGSSVMRYLLQQRLARANKLLTNNDDRVRISDIAWQCGFVSAAHFSRVFKKHYGTSPTTIQRVRPAHSAK
jgi:AraC-like DNA-binding protein